MISSDTREKKAYGLLREGYARQAHDLCAAAITTDPGNIQLRHCLALAEHQLGDQVAALDRLTRCADEAPDEAAVHADLGRMLALEERWEDAKSALVRAVTIAPAHDDAWHNLAQVHRSLGDPQGALAAVTRALRSQQRRWDSLVLLGEILLDDEQIEKAIRSFELAMAADPDQAMPITGLANTLAQRGWLAEAQQFYRRAIALDPNDAASWFSVASIAEDLGNALDAETAYRQSLALDPGQGFGIGRLLALVGDRAEPSLLERASWAVAAPTVPDEAKALVGYGLGKARERAGDIDGAFTAYKAANDARRRVAGPFDRDGFTASIDRLMERHANESHTETGASLSEQPVFIVGMPRSGTTLTEQILASHPLVHGAGELIAISKAATRLSSDEPGTLADEARQYLDVLRGDAPPGAMRIVDKAPLNFFHLGVVARMFPKARIIHCVRDPRDVCLSIYCENFAPEQMHATDFADLAHYWRGYRRLMDYWQFSLDNPLLNLMYEETIADVEIAARRLCDFVGIPWDKRCLEFYQNDRAVRTPSRWQVRQPIYTTSSGRWCRFAGYLKPLIDGLSPSWGVADLDSR